MKIISALILGGVLVFFGWAIMTLCRATWHQHQAESFPHVSGMVLAAE